MQANDFEQKVLAVHAKYPGKWSVRAEVTAQNQEELSEIYSPGVAIPCEKIKDNKELVYEYTSKGHTIAIISDGTAVLGLGDIGPEAGLPVMEGKAVLLKQFTGLDAVPLVVQETDPDRLIDLIVALSPSFGGINLEDISAPRCFYIEEELKKRLDIPVFHDDQHGTAIVVLAALINSLTLVQKTKEEIKVVINGIGAAGHAITELLLHFGVRDIILCDKPGILTLDNCFNAYQQKLVRKTNPRNITGTLQDALVEADVFIGVSVGDCVTEAMVKTMAQDPIIFAMANPIPEISYDLAKQAGAKIVGTGRSDHPNQINNVYVFPGMFQGLLKHPKTKVTEEIYIAAAKALASCVLDDALDETHILPNLFQPDVVSQVASAVEQATR